MSVLKQFGFVLLAAVLLAGFVPLAAAEEQNDSGAATPEPTIEATASPEATPDAEVREQRIIRLAEALRVRVERGVEKLENARDKLQADGKDVSEIDAALAGLRETTLALDEATTVAELKAALAEVKDAYAQLRERIQEKIREHAKTKVKNVIDRAKGLMDRIDRIITALKAKGADTTALEQKVSGIKAKLAEAEGVYGENVREAAHLLAQANRMLVEFKHQLRQKVAEAGGLPSPVATVEATATPTVEATVEATAEPTEEPEATEAPEATAEPTEEPLNQT